MPEGANNQTCVNCGGVVGEAAHYVTAERRWLCERSPERTAKLQKVHGTEHQLAVCEKCNKARVVPSGQCIACGHHQAT